MSKSGSLAIASHSSATEALTPPCLCIDIETPPSMSNNRFGQAAIHKLAAFRPDSGDRLVVQGAAPALTTELDALTEGAGFVLGHNLRRHDLPVLGQVFPNLKLLALPVVDTLELSPLAFPENPYHRLVKDYKLVSDARSQPLRDAELSLSLFHDELEAFRALQGTRPDDVALFHFLLAGESSVGLPSLFERMRNAPRPTIDQAAIHLSRSLSGKVCDTRLRLLGNADLKHPPLYPAIAYCVAWLRVAGGNSILPPWVHRTFTDTSRLIHELREIPCDEPGCGYCRDNHHAETLLARDFDKSSFRPLPANPDGGSLQRDIVIAGLCGQSLLAILPTGAGKSLCYQIPALAHYRRSGKLTVVISPLQSLMKDQIDNLVRQGIYSAVALNGLLTPPERRQVFDRIALGDAGIVLVSPEQFRNKTFADTLRGREIAAWVFDEAHCLSKWGHDFRTDYLYVSRFIRERFGRTAAPIACFTATAKPEVIADLSEHFEVELGIRLTRYTGGHERANLQYQIVPVTKAEKPARIIDLVREALAGDSGGAIVFTATRRNAEVLCEHIAGEGWRCAFFHAGLEPGTKREIQQGFVCGVLRVIVATNAFGMGIDKPDVRLVVHADIPGSLESYLQEGGRAGRDGGPARCVLLYDEADVETQFGLSARSRLTPADFAGILRALRLRSRKLQSAEIVVTAAELLLEEDAGIDIDPGSPDADTKVKTAIAHLERNRFLVREENRTRVFSTSLRVATLEEGLTRLDRADLSKLVRERYRTVLDLVIHADAREGLSTDELVIRAGIPPDECFRTLQNLEKLGILSNDLGLRVVLRIGVTDASEARLRRVSEIERALVDVMAEAAPDADPSSEQVGNEQVLTLSGLCQGVRERLEGSAAAAQIIPDGLLAVLRTMAHAFGGAKARRAMLDIRKAGSGEWRVRVRRPWQQIREITEMRRAVAHVLLRALLARLPPGLQSADAIVECKARDLTDALRSDLDVAARLRDPDMAIEQGLLYLHETEVLILDRGRTVFRSAMTIRLLPGSGRFSREDYAALERHYRERNLQIHVIDEFARRGAQKIADALALVAAYFSWGRDRFVAAYFAGRKELLEFATTAESYRRIVETLRNPVQERLVQARDTGNHLVLAGPGSGKTTVVVHRIAYLLRVLRAAPESIIALTFNRSAAIEVRKRLYDLVGNDAHGVTVLTYHAMALRLTGVSLAKLGETGQEPDFEALIGRAVDLLEGRVEVGADLDELRDRLLRGYRFILVDEYQDIDRRQYALVSALAGRTAKEGDTRLSIMAVGDDDQNIYSFRKTSVGFIRRFTEDYHAEPVYLVENYRSTQHIISVANEIIAPATGRMKIDHPIRIDHARLQGPPGGRWETLDELARGQVQLFRVPGDRNLQAQLALHEIERLRALDGEADWSDFAVLARTHETLEPIRAYCELHGIPYRTGERAGSGLSAIKTREGHALLRALRRRSGRLIPARALFRWIAARARADPRNRWWEDLMACALELGLAVGNVRVPALEAVEWFYGSAGARAREAPGHLNVLTAHGVKGRELKHVVVLDAGDWKGGGAEERRLLYVAMTRAKETLSLFQSRDNPFLCALGDSEAIRTVEPKVLPLPLKTIDRIHRELTPRDVDLGYAGRHAAQHPVHAAIACLKIGDALDLVERDLRDGAGRVVGRLAKGYALPDRTLAAVKVSAIVARKPQVQEDQNRARPKIEEWETVLCDLTFE